jgi:zinc D-Ala-D-Ala carboxypeptidase
MRVLVACEFSGVVRDAFRARGHDAVSCDLLPSERPGAHIVGDVRDILHDGWDLMIAHPPCTFLPNSGAKHLDLGCRRENGANGDRWANLGHAAAFFLAMLGAPIPRIAVEKPLIIRSAYRSPEHNRAIGGAKASQHMEGIAFDVAMANHDPESFEAAARAIGFKGFGFYPRTGFIHIDLGPARSWGERFPKRATAFAAETPPAREALSESRTLKGGGAAGVATVGAAGVEVAQQVLAETQGAVLPLVPYLDTLRWLLTAIALAGIAVAIYARLDDWKRGRR